MKTYVNFFKIQLFLILALSVWMGIEVKAQDLKWLKGDWIGISYQGKLGEEGKIFLSIDPKKSTFRAEYPSSNCRADWLLIEKSSHRAIFREYIFEGKGVCLDQGKIILTYVDDKHLSYSYFAVDSDELLHYATLIRVEEKNLDMQARIKMENKSCEHLFVDLEKGSLNGLKPQASQMEVKRALPCFTGDTPDGSEFNCGGGVFFLEHDIFFYSGRDYIEIRKNYPGKLSLDIMNRKTKDILKLLGSPERTEVAKKWDGEPTLHYFYPRDYGCLRLVFMKRRLIGIAIHAEKSNLIQLCE